MKNRLKKLSPQFKKILETSSALANCSGVKIYLVGGVVRDLILKRKVFDLDIVVEGNAITFVKKLASLLNSPFRHHHSFGTATIYLDRHKIDASTKLSIDPERSRRVDFATARIEEYSHRGALPKVSPATLAKDLLRRDFSINAMAISLNRADYGKLVDLCNGVEDLGKGLIRVLHNRSFQDDPTRILRAIRFEQRFSFEIESGTLKLIKEALKGEFLELVGPHRLRDEIILILKEPEPSGYIRRIKELVGFSFIDEAIELDRGSFLTFARIKRTALYYKKKFRKKRKLEVWLLYLAAIIIKLPTSRLDKFFDDFGFRKGERAVINSIAKSINKIKSLGKQTKASNIYRILLPYTLESILFFYAYYQNKNLRKNIELFLDSLVDIGLKIKGKDLKAMNLKPDILYNKILKKTLYSKIDKGLRLKSQEAQEAKLIFARHKKA